MRKIKQFTLMERIFVFCVNPLVLGKKSFSNSEFDYDVRIAWPKIVTHMNRTRVLQTQFTTMETMLNTIKTLLWSYLLKLF